MYEITFQFENGAQEVKLFGEPVQVRARIAQLGGLSGHADKDGLEAWLRAFDEKPKFVFVNHGEDAVAEHWANHLKEEGYEADAPYNGSIWIAAEGRVACAEVGNTQKIIKTKSAETVRTSAAYDRLANMGQRLLEVIRQDYVTTARAKGLGQKAITFKHQLRNALIPIITVMGTTLGGMIGGTVLVESIFVVPGLGNLMITAIKGRDFMVVENGVLVIAIAVALCNLVVDILYGIIDPRIRND